MADPSFFSVSGPYALKELAKIAGGVLSDEKNADIQITDVAPLSLAGPFEISFLDNKKYVQVFESSKAGAAIVRPSVVSKAPEGMNLIVMDDPYRGYARIARAFYPLPDFVDNIAPTACIDKSAEIGDGCRIDPGAVVEKNTKIGMNCWIGSNAVILKGVTLGKNTRVAPNVTLENCQIGSNVIIHAGVCIGQDGFGFAMGKDGHLKVPQLGRVIIEDDVEIGANTTIDRGTGPDTIIGAGSKIDNLVQIGHNVRIGRCCIIVSQVGISGSTVIGDFSALGGQVGIAGHLEIGAGVEVAAQSGIMRNVGPGEKIGGSPARPFREYMRSIAVIEKMSKKKGQQH